ncbi:MAG: c-type cytochrome [Campylobacterales bacterium]
MKKGIFISASLALLLLSGCGEKEEIQSDVSNKASEVTQEVVQDVKSDEKKTETIDSDTKNESAEVTKEAVEALEEDDNSTQSIDADIKDSSTQTNEEIVKEVEQESKDMQEDVEKLTSNQESGKELYEAKCQSCHGDQAQLRGLGKSEVIAGWDSAKIVNSLKGYKSGDINKYGLGATMKTTLSTMNDEQIQKVSDYISTLK